ncbi:MAG TPA: hypothetical protein VNI02_06790 [Blastocatellia bacterium]|nr:hypothetical protein [Blastocatellia bacterium]
MSFNYEARLERKRRFLPARRRDACRPFASFLEREDTALLK